MFWLNKLKQWLWPLRPRNDDLDEQFLRAFYALRLYFEIKEGWPGIRTEIFLPEHPRSAPLLQLFYKYLTIGITIKSVDHLEIVIRDHEVYADVPPKLVFWGELTRVGMHDKFRELAPDAGFLRWRNTHPKHYAPWEE